MNALLNILQRIWTILKSAALAVGRFTAWFVANAHEPVTLPLALAATIGTIWLTGWLGLSPAVPDLGGIWVRFVHTMAALLAMFLAVYLGIKLSAPNTLGPYAAGKDETINPMRDWEKGTTPFQRIAIYFTAILFGMALFTVLWINL